MNDISKIYKIIIDLLLVCESANIIHPAMKKAKLYLSASNADLIYNILYFIEVTLNISQEQLNSDSRETEIVKARRLFFNMAKEYTKESLTNIGDMVSKDHSTVLYGLKKMQEFKDTGDSEWDEYVQYNKLFLLQTAVKINTGANEEHEEEENM